LGLILEDCLWFILIQTTKRGGKTYKIEASSEPHHKDHNMIRVLDWSKGRKKAER
jgi:hypothetical protein